MSYIEENLMTGETVLHKTKLHWMVFFGTIFWIALAFLLFLSRESAPAGIIPLFLGIVLGINALIQYKTSEFGLTDKRVIIKTGFIRRDSIEILLTKVESIQVNQGIFGRISGYGTLLVGGTGGTKNKYRKIANPLEFRKKTQEQISVVQKSS
jgi:uncharacterized membrane protein YdbT with pleckstrin-like domain